MHNIESDTSLFTLLFISLSLNPHWLELRSMCKRTRRGPL